jgi:TRAP-type transport system periplasmic protein
LLSPTIENRGPHISHYIAEGKNMLKRWLTFALTLLAFATLARSARAEDDVTKVKLGTLAPKNSPWGQVFEVWKKGLSQRTNGKMEIEFFWNGTQGDEVAMTGKIRNGQLDGAALTATGLSQFSKSVIALQLPGWTGGDWSKLDKARDALKPMLDAEFTSQKVILAGAGDVGLAHVFSIGHGVKGPADVKDLSPFYIPGDPIGKTLMTKLGVPLQAASVPEILPKLGTGIKMLVTPALAAEQLQWASKITHANTMVPLASVGGLVLSQDKVNALPADLKAALLETGEVAGKALTGRIRREDAAAWERMKKKVEVYEPSAAELAEWQKLFGQVRTELCGSTIKQEACNLAK